MPLSEVFSAVALRGSRHSMLAAALLGLNER